MEFVAADWARASAPDQWFFPATPADRLDDTLLSTGLSPEHVARLTAAARPEPRIAGMVVTPEAALVRAITPDVRASLYTLLGKTALNFDQANSFRFYGTSADDWFAHSLISDATRKQIEPLLYRVGGFLHFADSEVVLSQVTEPEQRQRLAKVLLRQSTVIATLSVDGTSEVAGLAEYWGRGGRRTDVRPLLESVAGAGAGRAIDIVHLLPSFARDRLYRYPRLSTADFDKPLLANCLWTALNFFATEPDDRFLEVSYALDRMRRDYHVVEHGYLLGDVIAMLDDEGNIFHAAVYLADNLVFTKNGTSPVAPWTIMPLDRLKDYYRLQSANPRLIYHRRNDM